MGLPTLKPCPFCGSRASYLPLSDAISAGYPVRGDAKATRFIGCTGERCCVVSFCDMTAEEAGNAWNRRCPNG